MDSMERSMSSRRLNYNSSRHHHHPYFPNLRHMHRTSSGRPGARRTSSDSNINRTSNNQSNEILVPNLTREQSTSTQLSTRQSGAESSRTRRSFTNTINDVRTSINAILRHNIALRFLTSNMEATTSSNPGADTSTRDTGNT